MTKVLTLFPTHIAHKNLDLSKLIIQGKNFDKTFESGVESTLLGETLFTSESMNYFNLQLTDLLSFLLKPYCKNFVFKMTSIWINNYKDNDYQSSHVHPGHYSFILYYDVNKSNTVFNSPVKNLLETHENFQPLHYKTFEPNFKKGDIVVFPSYLEHWVKPNSNGLTIAGNIDIINLQK